MRQNKIGVKQSKQGNQIRPLNSNTSTREVANQQLDPLVIPTHSLGFQKFLAMCLLPIFFGFFLKYPSFGVVVLRLEKVKKGF